MVQLIVGYLILITLTTVICIGILIWLRHWYWPWRARKAAEKGIAAPVEPVPEKSPPEIPPAEKPLFARNQPMTFRQRVTSFRHHWRDAALADLLAGFRLPDSAYLPLPETVAEPLPVVPPTEREAEPMEAPVAPVEAIEIALEERPPAAASPDGQVLYLADRQARTIRAIRLPELGEASMKTLPPPPVERKAPDPPVQPAPEEEPEPGGVQFRWRYRIAVILAIVGLALLFRGLLMTQRTPPGVMAGGIRRLVGGAVLFALAAYLAESERRFSCFARWQGAIELMESFLVRLSRMAWSAIASLVQRLAATFSNQPIVQRVADWLCVKPWQLILLVMAPVISSMTYRLAGSSAQAIRPVAAGLCWLTSLVLVLAGGWKAGRGRQSDPVSVPEVLGVSGLLILALLLRVTATGHIPVILGGDEGVIGYGSVAFARGEANNLFNTTASSPSFYFALQGVSIRAFGHTIEALRFSSVIAGMLAVLATYWLARTLFDRRMAFIGAAYMAAFHFNIHFSRVALQNIWEELFAAVVLAGLWEGWQSDRRSGFLLAGLALGLAQSFFPGVRLLFLVLFVWLLFALLRDRARFMSRLPGLLLLALVVVVTVLPLAQYYMEYPEIYTEPLPRSFILAGYGPAHTHVFGSGRTMVEVLKDQFSRAVRGYTHLDLQDWYTPEKPMLLPPAAALFLMGLVYSLLRVGDLRYLMLLILLIGDLVMGVALTTDPPAGQRFVIAAPAVVLLIALPLERMSHWLSRLREGWAKLGRVALVALLLLIMVIDVYFYFYIYTPGRNFRVPNDEIAQRVAEHVNRLAPYGKGWHIYCVCPPRMGYWTHPTMAYLAPDAIGSEVIAPLEEPMDLLQPGEKALFVFLPERLAELDPVRQSYPDGLRVDHWYHNGDLLFATYEVVAGFPGE